MQIKSIRLKAFRRFSDLHIPELPPARLVVMAGPNGSGKSSILDSFSVHHRAVGQWGVAWDGSYHSRGNQDAAWTGQQVQIEFHGQPNGKKSYYLRSAYRNESDFQLGGLSRQNDPSEHPRLSRMIDQDSAVSQNFQMLASRALEDAFDGYAESMSLKDFREESIGDIKRAVGRLFPDLEMNTLGNPLKEGTFRFTKGAARRFRVLCRGGTPPTSVGYWLQPQTRLIVL